MIDNHEKGISLILKHHGVNIKLTRDGVDYQFKALFNAVEHGID